MDMTVSTEIQDAAQQPASALLNDGAPTTIRLGALYLDKRNVRKTKGKMPIEDLAAAILRQSLLQNLVIVPRKGKKKGQTHEVIAGGRRYQALMLLVSQGHITLDFMVAVKVVDDAHATSASLVENVAREAMHPADELDAFATLIDQGHSFETIGNTYGISAMTVRRRIKLLSVSPKLLALLRKDEITLEQLGALAINDSHEVQERVWSECKHSAWSSEPERLRARLTTDEIDVTENHIAKFVGMEAYEQAGGIVRRDLFSDEENGYIGDAALLYSLADAKLNAHADALRADGWSWVETRHERDYATFSRLGRLSAAVVIPDDLKSKVDEIEQQLSALSDEMDAFHEREDEPTDEEWEQNSQREERYGSLERQKDEIEKACAQWTAEQKAAAGAIVYIGRAGELLTECGLVRGNALPVSASSGEAMKVTDHFGREKQPKVRAAHSDKMVARLTAHRTIAVQAELMRRPDIALALLTARLAGEIFYPYANARGLQVRSTTVDRQLTNAAGDMEESADWEAVANEKESWGDKLPGSDAELFPWLLQQTPETVAELLAFCVARSIDGLRQTERENSPVDQLVDVLGMDMADHWAATENSYFGHISKKQMIAAVTEAVSAEAAAPLAALKKDAAAKAAELALRGVRWVPEPMRARAKMPVGVDTSDDE